MKMRTGFRYGVILILGCVSFLSHAEAGEWAIVGPRALGMGGANVAVANDATASYWNPGAFGFFSDPTGGDYGKRDWSTQFGVGVGAQIHENLGEELNKIAEFDFSVLSGGQISAAEVSNFIQLVDALKSFDANKNRAATILVNGGSRVQIGHFGIGGYLFGAVSAKGDIDLVNISPVSTGATFTIDDFTNPANFGCPSPCNTDTPGGLDSAQRAELNSSLVGPGGLGWTQTQADNFINAVDNGFAQSGVPPPADIVTSIESVTSLANTAAGAGGGGSFSNNQSRLLFKGIAIGEIPLTYGRAITEDFAIGGNIKYMKARVYDISVPIFDTEFGDALDSATDTYVEKQNFGIDLGLLYRFGDDLRMGLVGRNLNSPKFDVFKEKPQVRAGFAYKPLSFVTLAADIDLTKNETTVGSDFGSRNLGGGVELNLLRIIQLRGGAYKNLAEDDIGLVYTAGIGLNLWLINLDIGASMASESSKVDDKDIPKEARAEFALSMLF